MKQAWLCSCIAMALSKLSSLSERQFPSCKIGMATIPSSSGLLCGLQHNEYVVIKPSINAGSIIIINRDSKVELNICNNRDLLLFCPLLGLEEACVRCIWWYLLNLVFLRTEEGRRAYLSACVGLLREHLINYTSWSLCKCGSVHGSILSSFAKSITFVFIPHSAVTTHFLHLY